MGRKVSDGKAFNLTAPDAAAIVDYDLYRIGKINGVAIGSKAANEAKTLAYEADTNTIYSVKVPAGLTPAVGDLLFWADPTAFQRGDTNLVAAAATAGDRPCFWVTKAKNANGEVQGRVLNGVTGDADIS